MASKNIFDMLSASEDEEEKQERFHEVQSKSGQNQKQKKIEEKRVIPGMVDKKKRVRTKKEEDQTIISDQGFLEQKENRKANKQESNKPIIKNKDIIQNHRLMDKHSADGRKEGKAMKKQGNGKANWGTHKDELRQDKEEQTIVREEKKEEEEEEEEEVIGLKEYKSMQKKREVVQKQSEKKQVDEKQITKEGLSIVQTKKVIDDYDLKADKTRNMKFAAAQLNTENGDLLGLRTGFVTKDSRPQQQPRQSNRKNQNKNTKRNLNDNEDNFPSLS